MRLATMLVFVAAPAFADGEAAGDFDYYVLSLSWSPTWCALEGDAKGSDQCDPRHDYGFTLHGLWPQNESGWPSYCRTTAPEPSRAETRSMADVMGSDGLAWYEWKKHGRCSGLSAADYFALARRAYENVTVPPVFLDMARDVRLPAQVVEAAFLEANPPLSPNDVRVTCEAGRIDEVRICLTRELVPRACGSDAARDCRMTDALMAPVR